MTIDERLEAITMNLELTSRDVADLQKATARMQEKMDVMQDNLAALQDNTARFQQATADRVAQWELEKKHLDEKVDSLAVSTQMLLTAIEAQQNRIERVERRVS